MLSGNAVSLDESKILIFGKGSRYLLPSEVAAVRIALYSPDPAAFTA